MARESKSLVCFSPGNSVDYTLYAFGYLQVDLSLEPQAPVLELSEYIMLPTTSSLSLIYPTAITVLNLYSGKLLLPWIMQNSPSGLRDRVECLLGLVEA